MELLSVDQIQSLETFVQQRKGVFNFNSYEFSIQKRLDIHEFTQLLQSCNINANITNATDKIIQLRPRISFGEYKGMFFEDLDDSYLLWLHSNYKGSQVLEIQNELKTRKLI